MNEILLQNIHNICNSLCKHNCHTSLEQKQVKIDSSIEEFEKTLAGKLALTHLLELVNSRSLEINKLSRTLKCEYCIRGLEICEPRPCLECQKTECAFCLDYRLFDDMHGVDLSTGKEQCDACSQYFSFIMKQCWMCKSTELGPCYRHSEEKISQDRRFLTDMTSSAELKLILGCIKKQFQPEQKTQEMCPWNVVLKWGRDYTSAGKTLRCWATTKIKAIEKLLALSDITECMYMNETDDTLHGIILQIMNNKPIEYTEQVIFEGFHYHGG
jgi:hypothetical protein